ncbi:methyltransferase domain-containing protein [Candidatus Daviesbacteria bacterium]|nr:methyltransferase domain-containing protein [Candidatus Daviesbacteria bacterium]
MYLNRAYQVIPNLIPHLSKRDKILDIGSGTGIISKIIKKKLNSNNITLTDIDYNEICDEYPVIIFDGKNLPFKKNQFTKSLLITVLHHSSDPRRLLREAKRVTSGEIIIMEDVFTDILGRTITFIGDCLVNFELHPFSRNHTTLEWVKIFQKEGFKIKSVKEFKLICVGFPFKLAIFVLSKG